MTSDSATANRRQRGSIRPHRSGYQIRVTAGTDPATGERIVLTETSPTLKEAERTRFRLLAEADAMKTARIKASFGHLLDLWFSQHEVGVSARATYESLIPQPHPSGAWHSPADQAAAERGGDPRALLRRSPPVQSAM